VEGKNIVIEWRFAEGKADRLPGLAVELVRLKVDVIVTSGPAATRAAKEATVTIPIVTAQDPDPVGNGLVASLARPGGNRRSRRISLTDSGRESLPAATISSTILSTASGAIPPLIGSA
jgi:putative tryptophan/tyrosine transport system substrate-binding protein